MTYTAWKMSTLQMDPFKAELYTIESGTNKSQDF